MVGVPNEEKPTPPVSQTHRPPNADLIPVTSQDDWSTLAARFGVRASDLIELNFPGIAAVRAQSPERAARQVNWYLKNYVGCRVTKDGENWAFSSGITGGQGPWQGGKIFVPKKAAPTLKITPHRCSPTSSGKLGRRPTFYRLLKPAEQALLKGVFGNTLPGFEYIGIGNGLGFDGRPWTDNTPMNEPDVPKMMFEVNVGDAAMQDLTGSAHASCYVTGIPGTLAGLLVHELTHVWQYHNSHSRMGVWGSSVAGGYAFTPGDPWEDYNVEQQAEIVEKWFYGKKDLADPNKADPLYPYVRLVIRSGRIAYPRTLTLAELAKDLAELKARGMD
jgi:hypothetical protein